MKKVIINLSTEYNLGSWWRISLESGICYDRFLFHWDDSTASKPFVRIAMVGTKWISTFAMCDDSYEFEEVSHEDPRVVAILVDIQLGHAGFKNKSSDLSCFEL